MVSLGTYQCVVFADIRGDYELLQTIVSRFYKNKKWLVSNTTIVCLGNYVNRFKTATTPEARLLMKTQDAIKDELKILECFAEMEKPNEQGNRFIALVGNHELACILDLPGYEYNQMANPSEQDERDARKAFVDEHLRPFMEKHGVMVGWSNIYCSHGSLNKSWFEKQKIKSLPDLNQKWSRYLRTNQTNQLKRFADPDSPIMSSSMLTKPHTWREFEAESITHILGPDNPNPKFVQATLVSVEDAPFCSFDTNLQPPKFEFNEVPKPVMLASRNYDATDQIYFIYSKCQPAQVLQFQLYTNNENQPLYTKTFGTVFRAQECVYSPTIPKPLDETELALLGVSSKYAHIEKVSIVLFSHDMQRILFVKTDGFSLPTGRRKVDETDWDAMTRVLQESTGMNQIRFVRGGAVSDFQGSMRVWFKKTLQSITSPNIEWLHIDTIMSNTSISRGTKSLLCIYTRTNLIPHLADAQYVCGGELVNQSDTVKKWW